MRHRSLLPASLSRRTDDELRRVGFEIEFGGLTFEVCLEALTRAVGADIDRLSPIEALINHPEFGKFELELDWQFLKDQAREDYIQTDVMKLLGDIAGTVVPLELVFPPIDITRIGDTDDIIEALRQAGALGTHESLLYAFGVHINTEIPDLEAATVTRYLKAYALLQPWLLRAHGIDSSRRISPYVDLYKRRYLDLVIDYDAPSIDTLIDDYLEHNATRNRALDMLPMFSEIDQDRVRRVVDDARIKSRPTFHYRMPNCDIGNPEWSLISEWNRWCIVELLAHSDELESLAEEYRNWRKADVIPTDTRWLTIVDRWVTRTIE